MRQLLSAILAMGIITSAQAADGGAAARIGAYDDAIVATMKQSLPLAQRVARFQPLVENYYDMPAIAALVAGPGWAGASTADRRALTDALTRHSALALARNFAKYDGERFQVDPAVQARGDSTVVKLIITGGGSGDTLYFRMRQGTGGWKIVDVISGGVSQLAVQRSDLASTLAAEGISGAARRLAQIDAKAAGGR